MQVSSLMTMKPKLLIAIASVLAIGVLSVYFLFLVDRTPPGAPVLASPINGFIVERAPGYSLSFFGMNQSGTG